MIAPPALLALALAAQLQAGAGTPAETTRADTTQVRLADMVRAALVRNLTVQQAEQDVRVATSTVLAARSAFDPNLFVGPTFTANTGAAAGRATDGLASHTYLGEVAGLLPTGAEYSFGTGVQSALPGEPRTRNSFTGSIVQPLLRGFGPRSVQASLRATDRGLDAARARLEGTRTELVARIEIAYYNLVRYGRAEAVAARSLQRAGDLLEAYTELRRIGRITEIDLTTARLGVTFRRAALLDMVRARQDAQDALILDVYGERAPAELPADDVVLLATDTALVVPALPLPEEAIAGALANRPDLEAIRMEVARSGAELEVARNGRLPSLGLVAGVSTTALTHDALGFGARGLGEARSSEWRAGLVLSYPLRNQAARAQADRAAAFNASASLAMADAENETRAAVRSAYRGIVLGGERLALGTEATRLARDQYEGERERLRLGLSDIFRLLQYEEQSAQAEFEEVAAWAQLAYAASRYRAVTGSALERYGAPGGSDRTRAPGVSRSRRLSDIRPWKRGHLDLPRKPRLYHPLADGPGATSLVAPAPRTCRQSIRILSFIDKPNGSSSRCPDTLL